MSPNAPYNVGQAALITKECRGDSAAATLANYYALDLTGYNDADQFSMFIQIMRMATVQIHGNVFMLIYETPIHNRAKIISSMRQFEKYLPI